MIKYVKSAVDEDYADEWAEMFDKLSENDKKEFAYEFLVRYDIADESAIELVTDINGDSYDTLCDILYARTGYKDFDQVGDRDTEDIANELGLK